MLLACTDEEVMPGVVILVSADVMNSFPAMKNPAELLFCYKAMLIVPAAAK